MLNRMNILIDFKINQDYIAQMFCINKSEPVTQCKGSCYLSKQLRNSQEQEQSSSLPNEKQEVTYYSSKYTLLLQVGFPADVNAGFNYYQSSNSCLHVLQVFHPPQMSVI